MDIEKWNIDILVDACANEPKNKIKLEIPKFQRRRDWKDYQENELIETMQINRISIGVLQIYKLESLDIKNKYLLIDGLHRVSTILKYYNNIFEFETTKKQIDDIIKQITDDYNKYNYDIDIKELESILRVWFGPNILGESYKEVIDRTYKLHEDKLKKNLKKYIKEKESLKIVKDMILSYTKKLCKNIDLSNTIIPVIINVGNQDTLPILFKRINQNGTPLTSSDILAALWYNDNNIKIENKKIIDGVNEHYEGLKKENHNIEIYINHNKDLYNPYEYLIGLHKTLLIKHENTFYPILKDKELIFKLISCCLFNDVSKKYIEQINDKIKEMNLEDFEKKLDWSIKFVSNTLDKIMILQNGHKPKLLVRESIIYICLIAYSYKYKSIIEKEDKYYSNLIKIHILNDKLSERGFNNKIVESIISEKRYMELIDESDFINKINRYIDENMKIRNNKDKISNISSLILYILAEKNINNGMYLDIGNIVLKKNVLKYNENKSIRKEIPLNSLGNLCVYNVIENKRKPNETIYDYLIKSNISDKDILDEYFYMNNNHNFDDILRQDISKKEYNNFLKYRAMNIRDTIIDNFKSCFKEIKQESEDSENSDISLEKPVKLRLSSKKIKNKKNKNLKLTTDSEKDIKSDNGIDE